MSELESLASDAERERAVVQLREAHAEGRLTLEEFSRRADLAYAARTRQDLEQTTADLPTPSPSSRKRPRRFALGLFGGPTFRGRWRAARRFYAVAVFGGVDLDLREAQLDADGLTVVSFALFGGNDIYVPEGIEVDLGGLAIFGGNDERGREGQIHAGAPLVRVVAFSLFGGTDVNHVPARAREPQP